MSDVKNFDQDEKINIRNDRFLCQDPYEVSRIMYNKFSTTLMVLEVVSHKGYVIPPYFFPQRLRVNSTAYIEVLQVVIKPWIESVQNKRPNIFQQNSSSIHKTKLLQE